MTRKTIITILIAVLAAVVVGVLWMWFFGSAGTAPSGSGTFGTGGTRTAAPGQGGGNPTNIPNSIPGQTVGSGGGGSSSYIRVNPSGAAGAVGTTNTPPGTAPGVDWLSGSNYRGGSGTTFTPATINQLNNGSVGGSVNVLGTYGSPDPGGGSGIGGAAAIIGATAVGCLVFMAPGAGATPSFPPALYVQNSQDNNKKFMDCLARTIARAAVQQLTNSVVNWINSGFNGQPAFVTNYQQFFNNVADQAAGEFIKTYTNFAPYCTPFRNQIRIALANSYARRNTAPACTLTQLLSGTGINPFGNNKGSAPGGGWGSLLSFTTNPSNNPYGAYMGAQVRLQGTLAQASQNANRNISPGGFLNFQEPYNCKPQQDPTTGQTTTKCQYKVTTPGATIQDSLSKTLGISQDTLTQAGISGSFDAIIGALISQLMTRALQGGVSNLSGQNGYASYFLTPDQQAAQERGRALLTQLQGFVSVAQQYGQSQQGSIQDIQNVQNQLSSLANCWQAAASSTELTAAQQAFAAGNAQSALGSLQSFDAQIASLNAEITRANAAIAALQELQTRTLSIGSTADVDAIQAALDAALAQGTILGPANLTQAQQDRATLQVRLATLSQAISSDLNRCYAFY